MAVDVGFILHGKPNEGSHCATENIDGGLRSNIIDSFFRDMSSRKDVALLVVDARCWQGQWYGVYTFWCGSNGVKEISNRDSYIALSVVIRGHYCTLVSDMYEHLKRVYEGFIVGKYVQQGKYLVGNLNDVNLFNGLCQSISTGFPEAMKPFDNTFQPQANVNDSVAYNIVDCDARAFVNDWKQCGRIIVSTQAKTKDSYRIEVENLNKELNEELEMSKKKHREKDEQIKGLNNDKASTQKELDTAKQSEGNLSKEVKTLRSQVQALQTQCQASTEALTKIADIVTEFAKVTTPQEIKSTESVWAKIKKSFDTFLLILILVGVGVFMYKAFTPDEAEQKEMTQMKAQITDMHNVLSQLHLLADNTQIEDAQTDKKDSKDVDCNIQVTQSGKTISKTGGRVDFSQPMLITIGKRMKGYNIYTDNISNEAVVKENIYKKQEVNINPNDKSKEVVIWYQSKNRSNANRSNKITLKQQ